MRFLALLPFAVALSVAAEIPTADIQIAAAVLSAPEELRAGAAVLGYKPDGKLARLREGKNQMVCLISDPAKPTFESACYHKDLEPYMARGRELTAAKVAGRERTDTRFKDIQEGRLTFPKDPRTLYVLTGTLDPKTGAVSNQYLRWVIYSPFATPESTGLSTKSTSGGPWLMGAGTQGAHIMISPPKK
jgi:hypothetical protein